MATDKKIVSGSIDVLRDCIRSLVADDVPMTVERAAQIHEYSGHLIRWCKYQSAQGDAPVADTEPTVPEADTTVPDTNSREENSPISDVWQPWVDAPGHPILSGMATHRQTPYRTPRLTAFVDLVAKNGCTERGHWFGIDEGLSGLLERLPQDVIRVYIVGPREVLGKDAKSVREWFMAQEMPAGWTTAPQGHYIDQAARNPIGRWRHLAHARDVEVARAAVWFGDETTDVRACALAWQQLRRAVEEKFGRGAAMLSTPATTGRDLWRRTIPESCDFPVLSDEWREIIASTSGQGRNEVVYQGRRNLPGIVHLDGRWMYAALTWGLPVGEPIVYSSALLAKLNDEETARLVMRRGRWQITARVPHNWAHVGLLMAPTGDDDDDARWRYPRQPGEKFTTWADASEVQFAMANGWDVQLHTGLAWAEGKPLNRWTDKLKEMRAELADKHKHEPEVADLCATAVRAILLYAIGAFASRSHPTTHVIHKSQESLIPAGTLGGVRRVADHLVYEMNGRPSTWIAEQAHPEWAAAVWARARHRLLSHRLPAGSDRIMGGAMTMRMDQVVAFRTDAIYLTDDPGWPDDGAVGRFRVKGRLFERVPEPQSTAALFELRDRAAATYEREGKP